MQAALEIVDESPAGRVLRRARLRLASERATVREIVERRVRHEVEAFNARDDARVFNGLVQPTDTEIDLNGYRQRKPRKLDADAHVETALEAFAANGFFVIVDDRQVESLDEVVTVGEGRVVAFVKLVPLVGG